jgi:hypothetical protein
MKTGILTQSYLMPDAYSYSAIDAKQWALEHLEHGIGEQLLQAIMASTKPLVVQRGKTYAEPDLAFRAMRYTMECLLLYSDWLDCEVGECAVYRDQVITHNGVAAIYQGGSLIMRFQMVTMRFGGDPIRVLRREV